MMSEAGVSVIICCHNSASRLPDTLKHLAKQRLADSTPWEVVLVNNASSDDTAVAASQIWTAESSPAPLRIVDEPTPGLSHARERGIVNSRYGTIVFVDDDNWLAEDYLDLAHQIMSSHAEIGALGGKIDARFETEPPEWFADVQSEYAVGPQGEASGDITHDKCHLAGAGMVLRKSTFEELKRRKFQFLLPGRTNKAVTSGEDTELCFALALLDYRIWYDDRLRLMHFIPKERLAWRYIRGLVRGNQLSAAIIACYEAALNRPKDSAGRVYFTELAKRAKWAGKSVAKFLLGCQPWAVCQLALLQLWYTLLGFPEMLRVFRRHSPEFLRLKHDAAR